MPISIERMLWAGLVVLLTTLSTVAGPAREYAYGSDPKQVLDVYRPENGQNAPVIVMLHGGAWRIGDKSNAQVWRAKSRHWNGRGWIFVSVNTRLLPDADPLEQTKDLARALAFVQRKASDWGGDPDKIVLMGHSAGAHVAALLTAREDIWRRFLVRKWRGSILLDTQVLDTEAFMSDDPSRFHIAAFGRSRVFWKASSPIRHLSRADPPMMVVCARGREKSCPVARKFQKVAGDAGVPVHILPVYLRHSQINARLGRGGAYTDMVDDWIEDRLR